MNTRDTVLILGVVLMMSLNLILQKFAVSHMSAILIGFLRASLMVPLLFIFSRPPQKLWRHAVVGFFMVSLYLTLFGYGLHTEIDANISAFVLQFQTFFVILCCYLILGEKPKWYQSLGILIACIGIFFLHNASTPEEIPIVGSILLIAACAALGLGIALSKKYSVGNSIKDVTWMSVLAAPPLLLACLAIDGPYITMEGILNMSPTVLACIVFATYASTLWGTYVWLKLIQKYDAATVTPFILLIPVFSGIMAYIAFEEVLSFTQLIAGLIILVGVICAQGQHVRLAPFLLTRMKRLR